MIIAFDIGNVLVHVNLDSFCSFLVNKGIFDSVESAEKYTHSIQKAQDVGLCDISSDVRFLDQRYDKRIVRDVTITQEELILEWNKTVVPSKPMIRLVELLDSTFHKIALLSNIGHDHASYLRSQCEVFGECIQHFSCEVGARKPSKLFYQSFITDLKYLGMSKQNRKGIIFFDDNEQNVNSAESYFDEAHLFHLKSFVNDEAAAEAIMKIINDKRNSLSY